MTELFPYQAKAVKRIHKLDGRCLLSFEMGLGKTLTAMQWAREREAFPMVVICQASAKWNWRNEARNHMGWSAAVLEGSNPERNGSSPQTTKKMYVLNYDILKGWLPFLRSLKPKLVVIDECSNIKNRFAKRTKHIKKLCETTPHVLALSGTPLLNRPAELWPTINLLRPDVFGSWPEFGTRFCSPHWTPWGMKYDGAANLGELRGNLLEHVMIRRRVADVLPELPEMSRHLVPLPLSDRREYDLAEREFLGWLRLRMPEKEKRARRALQLTKMGYLKRLAAHLKMPAVLEWLDGFLEDSEGKILIYCLHTEILRKLYERHRRHAVFIDGSVTGRDRQTAVDRFQKDRKTRMMIGNIIAAGTSINLTAAQDTAFVELDWVPGNHLQAERRTRRIGQERKTRAWYLVAHGTIEEHLAAILQEKQQIIGQTLDGDKTRHDDLNILDLLERRMKK